MLQMCRCAPLGQRKQIAGKLGPIPSQRAHQAPNEMLTVLAIPITGMV